MARGPSRAEALPRDGAFAIERVIDRDRLIIRRDDHDRVSFFRPADGLQAQIGYRVLTARHEALQFVISERVLGRAGEAEPARSFDRPHGARPEQRAAVAHLTQTLFREVEAEA